MEHVRLRPIGDTGVFVKATAGFAVAALVMFGVSGTVYNLVAPSGWLAGIFGRSLAGGLAAILALLIVGLCVKLTYNLLSVGDRNRYLEVFAYGSATTGAIYAVQYLGRSVA